MRDAGKDRANPRLKVLAYLTKEQHKQVLKSTSQEHGSVMVLGRYLLISPYAQGGGGKIYLATDTHTGGKVVVKCLPYHHDADRSDKTYAQLKVLQKGHPGKLFNSLTEETFDELNLIILGVRKEFRVWPEGDGLSKYPKYLSDDLKNLIQLDPVARILFLPWQRDAILSPL